MGKKYFLRDYNLSLVDLIIDLFDLLKLTEGMKLDILLKADLNKCEDVAHDIILIQI